MAVPTSTEKGQNVDMLALPPAGVSLTQDNSKFPWGNPPKEAAPDKVLPNSLDSLANTANKENMLKLLLAGVSVETLVEGWVYSGFESGEHSLDTGLLLKAPIATYIASIAEEEGIPYRLFEDDAVFEEDEIPDETVLKLMKKNNPNMYNYFNEQVNKVIRMGGVEQIEKDMEEAKPQSFLLSEKPVAQGEKV